MAQRLQKQKTPVPEEKYEEVKSLESLCELEKQTKLLINPPRSRRFSRTGRFAGTTCGVVEYPEASGGREAIPEENAAVLEILEKNGAFASTSGVRKIFI